VSFLFCSICSIPPLCSSCGEGGRESREGELIPFASFGRSRTRSSRGSASFRRTRVQAVFVASLDDFAQRLEAQAVGVRDVGRRLAGKTTSLSWTVLYRRSLPGTSTLAEAPTVIILPTRVRLRGGSRRPQSVRPVSKDTSSSSVLPAVMSTGPRSAHTLENARSASMLARASRAGLTPSPTCLTRARWSLCRAEDAAGPTGNRSGQP
jgi:hypothetical protein